MLSSWELELRCLMNWKDFKCSWIMKSSERWRGEHSGRCARLADQEDLPALSARRRKDLPESPPEVQARDVPTQTSFTTIDCARERQSTTKTPTVDAGKRFAVCASPVVRCPHREPALMFTLWAVSVTARFKASFKYMGMGPSPDLPLYPNILTRIS